MLGRLALWWEGCLVCPTGGNYELRACTDRLYLTWKAGCKGVVVLGRNYSHIGNKRQ
jgi:hypothetical protein